MGGKKIIELPEGYDIRDIEKLIKEDKQEKKVNQYRRALSLFIEIIKETKHKVIITLDGRDTAGKGYTLKKMTEYLDTRVFNIVSFGGIPKPEERKNWFERYSSHFFSEEKIITLFDRSWYNRAIVEPVMDFCTLEEYEDFMKKVIGFEESIISDQNTHFRKVYLSISREVQKKRLEEREEIMKRWKSSKVDEVAQQKWEKYTYAKRQVLEKTNVELTPWHVIDSNIRYLAVIEVIKLLINSHQEVANIVSKKLKVNLKPNKKIYRLGKDELILMNKRGEYGKPFNLRKAE
ncbi:polyphosphate kinase 2 [Candidatus Gracilibacteria bacterium]|nr:polyphosphate kinase 2 [Candidatus Gracilibacteria bacterium]NUJ99380.1 polyphosphate kinase 2 [Candidatus Gracilibacteria bacterium]